jgi:hypothetical protein
MNKAHKLKPPGTTKSKTIITENAKIATSKKTASTGKVVPSQQYKAIGNAAPQPKLRSTRLTRATFTSSDEENGPQRRQNALVRFVLLDMELTHRNPYQ